MAGSQSDQVANIERILTQTGQKLGISAPKTTDASGTVTFSVSFDSGAFFGKLIKEQINQFQSVLQPVIPVFNFLSTEVPLLSDYPDVFKSFDQDSNKTISVLDVVATAYELKTGQPANIGLVSDILSLSKFVSNFPAGDKTVLGELTVDASGIIHSQSASSGISIAQPVGLPKVLIFPY